MGFFFILINKVTFPWESKKVHTSELQKEQGLVENILKVLLTVIAYSCKDTFATYFARVWAPNIT